MEAVHLHPQRPYSLFGHYALHLWMLTAVAVSLAGAVFAGRIAYRLTARRGRPPGRCASRVVAAIVGGACVLGIQDGSLSAPGSMSYFHYVLSAQSDSMIVTFCLAAIDMLLCAAARLGVVARRVAGLGRPEVWPFTAPVRAVDPVAQPDMRWMVVAGAVITAFFWFGVPTITNGKPNVAGQLALKSPRELHNNKIVGTHRSLHLAAVLCRWRSRR